MKSKSNLRSVARRQRKTISPESAAEAAVHMAEQFIAGPLKAWKESRRPVIGGYWPFGSEMDTKPLLNALVKLGYDVALPVTDAIRPALIFRKWEPGVEFIADAMGIKSPPSSATMMAPDIVIVPALAFARTGHRIGYGTGYYDSTLRHLRSVRPIVAVAVVFASQEIPAFEPEDQDEPVDWITTESYALQIR